MEDSYTAFEPIVTVVAESRVRMTRFYTGFDVPPNRGFRENKIQSQKVIKGMGFSLRLCLRGAGLVEWYRARLYAGVR